MPKLNPLNIRSKKEALYANSILHSSTFKKSRGKTLAGKKLYNKEIKMVEKKFKQFGFTMNKKAKPFKI